VTDGNYLPTNYQSFIHLSRYSRWIEDEKRREAWPETVARLFNFFIMHLDKNLGIRLENELWEELEEHVLSLQVMPSMRALMTSGKALERENIASYNCSYIPIDNPKAFDEVLYVLMNGTGVGFSVERQYVSGLPTIHNREFEQTDDVISVADSKEGWARAFRDLISYLYTSRIPKVNVSKVRLAGSRLKTFGGRASGPQPLINLFDFTIEKFKNAKGRKLTSIECHDIVCKTGDVVVVGGVRRSALISLSNLSDDRMRSAKTGEWSNLNPERSLANNSAVYTGRPDTGTFMKEWLSLYESKSGERGIFNRASAQEKAKQNGRRDADVEFGTNPCSEIILRPNQFCNLTEVVVRAGDTVDTLKRKVKIATILGTIQATFTNFGYLRKRWQNNTEEERLLGVSLTGILDNYLALPWIEGSRKKLIDNLNTLRSVAVQTNKDWSGKLGIPQSTAITCVKPSGTVSQLVDSASGIHARHNPFYVRTVRGDNKDPLTQFMIASGIPNEPEIRGNEPSPDITVFSFPMKAPNQAVCRNDISAIKQLELWRVYAEHWCEHKPSVTISVREYEWVNVGSWCWNNFDHLSGVAFLPHSDHTYKQAPYQDIKEEEYEKLSKKMPTYINWQKLQEYEKEDNTKGSQELACTAGVCELVDI
jgi:ribonucleoside-diphosphate reductase alpha chain